jgi:hypothetical protein
MTQEEKILYEIEKRGGRITTHELMGLNISQYQARLKGLREKLAKKGVILSPAIPHKLLKDCYVYTLKKEPRVQDGTNEPTLVETQTLQPRAWGSFFDDQEILIDGRAYYQGTPKLRN